MHSLWVAKGMTKITIKSKNKESGLLKNYSCSSAERGTRDCDYNQERGLCFDNIGSSVQQPVHCVT